MATPQPLADRPASDNNSLNSNSEGSGELTAVVDDLLNQLNTKFTTISSELLAKKVDDMSRRLDNLEATIQAGDGSKSSGSGK